MPRVTALRGERDSRVAVELDGALWRTLPLDAVARAGVALGAELDRERLRTLARELRRSRALDTAARAATRRELPARAVAARLARAGVAPKARAEAIETLERIGVVDDARFAAARASALAGRGYGDAAIRWRLEHEGVTVEVAARAVAELEPERERARRIVERRGGGAAAYRYLARRGFSEDAVETVVAA